MAARGLMEKLAARIPGGAVVFPVQNDFFGRSVTVSGLLTGCDVTAQVADALKQRQCREILLPENMFRSGTEDTLDGMTRGEIEHRLGVPVRIGFAYRQG
jgi:NifB/MoaA-like Fe-S oxidoreductase